MTTTSDARPRLWPLGVAIAACLFFAVMFLGGGTTPAHSAVPHSAVQAGAPHALDTGVFTETVTETDTQIITNTVVNTVTSCVCITATITDHTTIPTTVATTLVHDTTSTSHVRQTDVSRITQTAHINSTAVLNVTNTNQINTTNTVVNTQNLTKIATSTAIITGSTEVEQSNPDIPTAVITVSAKPKALADRARLAIGAGGVAVTSAAGFGFLMLRRRGRYTG